jgi:hypothetical protein
MLQLTFGSKSNKRNAVKLRPQATAIAEYVRDSEHAFLRESE